MTDRKEEVNGVNTYVVVLHDANLQIFRGEKQICQSPGYAFITSKGIEVGSAALNRARLNPRQVNHQFWLRLSTDRLSQSSAFARHYADLAYLHLQHLSQYIEEPAQVIFSVPSSYSSDQLSLLIGIARTCAFRVAGLVDSAVAVASISELPADSTLVIDMQLHQTDIVTLSKKDGNIHRRRVESINLGLVQIHDKWMQLIADAFIDQCRFDPLHDAATEQTLVLKLNDWFKAIRNSEEVLLELTSSGQRVQARLQSAQVIDQVMPFYQKLSAAIDQARPETNHLNLLVGDEVASLPGLRQCLPAHQVIPANAISLASNQHLDIICRPDDGPDTNALAFVTALPLGGASIAVPDKHQASPKSQSGQKPLGVKESANRPSHILHGHFAYSLEQPLFIGTTSAAYKTAQGDGTRDKGSENLQLGYSAQDFASLYCSVVNNGGEMELRVFNDALLKINGEPVSGSRVLDVSDQITLEPCGITLSVIGEIHNGAPA